MPASCDHLLWGAPNLDDAVGALFEQTGVRATYGGPHPDLGTHNALAALGRKCFLEVLAPDPALPSGALAHRLHTLEAPTLLMWAARVTDVEASAARARAEGYDATVVEGHRPRPDGTIVRWTNVFVAGHGAGSLVPFFIAWHDGPHPAADAAPGLSLHAFRIETPQPEALRTVLDALDVRATVRKGPLPRLVAIVDTPRGRVELAGPRQ